MAFVMRVGNLALGWAFAKVKKLHGWTGHFTLFGSLFAKLDKRASENSQYREKYQVK